MAKKRASKKSHSGRAKRLEEVVGGMADVDFFDYRLRVKPNGVQELNCGHTDLRQGLRSVETACEELRKNRYVAGRALLMRAINELTESDELLMKGLDDLKDYFCDHPEEVKEICGGVHEMNEGRRSLLRALQSLDETKTGESLEFSRCALAHLRDAAHRVGSQLREIRDRSPAGFAFEILDLRLDDE